MIRARSYSTVGRNSAGVPSDVETMIGKSTFQFHFFLAYGTKVCELIETRDRANGVEKFGSEPAFNAGAPRRTRIDQSFTFPNTHDMNTYTYGRLSHTNFTFSGFLSLIVIVRPKSSIVSFKSLAEPSSKVSPGSSTGLTR